MNWTHPLIEGKQKGQRKEPTNTLRPDAPPPRIRYGHIVLQNSKKIYGSPAYLRGFIAGLKMREV